MLSNHKIKAFLSTVQPDKAKTFYTETIGLKLLSQDDFGFELEANTALLRISKVEKLTPQPFTVLGWETDDIITTIRHLNEKGVSFERYPSVEQDVYGIWIAPGGTRVAWFKDPDGNLLSLSDHSCV